MPVKTPASAALTPRRDDPFDLAEILRQSAETWAGLGLLLDAILMRRAYP